MGSASAARRPRPALPAALTRPLSPHTGPRPRPVPPPKPAATPRPSASAPLSGPAGSSRRRGGRKGGREGRHPLPEQGWAAAGALSGRGSPPTRPAPPRPGPAAAAPPPPRVPPGDSPRTSRSLRFRHLLASLRGRRRAGALGTAGAGHVTPPAAMLSFARGVVREEPRRARAAGPRGGSDWLHGSAGKSWWGGGVWPPSGPAVVSGAARLAERSCRDSYFNSPVAVTQFSYMLPRPVVNKLYLFHALATVGK